MSAGEQAISGRVLVGSHLSSLIPEIIDAYSIALDAADARQAWTDDDLTATRRASERALSTVAVELAGISALAPEDLRDRLASDDSSGADPIAPAVLFAITTDRLANVTRDDPTLAPATRAAHVFLVRNLLAMTGSEPVICVHTLVGRIENARSEERARLSRDIHDELGSQLAVVHHDLELADMAIEVDPADVSSNLAAARAHLQDTMTDLRRLLGGLRRSTVSEMLPVASELAAYATSLGASNVQTDVHGDESWIPPHIRREISLVAREAIRNGIKHGRSDRISVNVVIDPLRVTVSVEDDGTGFDLTADSADDAGLGLISMKERIEHIGGSLRIDRTELGWTRVRVSVPLLQEHT